MVATKRVFLGRFAPLHLGHQQTIDKLINLYGVKSVIIIIGSSSNLDQRTPYTFAQRKQIIRTIYPEIKILPLPDSKKNNTEFTETGNIIWLNKIKSLEKNMNAKFIFYGGSPMDLEILNQKFNTQIIVDRNITKISATKVRELFANKQLEKLRGYLDKRVISQLAKIDQRTN